LPGYDSYTFAMRNTTGFLGLLLLLAGCLWAQRDPANLGEGFDKPLKKTVVDFGASPFYPASRHIRKRLTCFYYSAFAVKEYDAGEKGAEWLSIVPSAHCACTLAHGENEKVYTSEWSGYFRGAKGKMVFFDASDGDDGGLPFVIFEVGTGRKLFEDSSILDYYQKRLHIKEAFQITGGTDPIIRLNYFRVARAGCNLKFEKAACWNKVRTDFGITQTDIPVCTGYEHANWDSAIVYPVSVLLTDSPQIRAVDGPVFCWPTD
jgi:hypothetical protein